MQVLISSLIFLLFLNSALRSQGSEQKIAKPLILTNENYIQGLSCPQNLLDKKAVFSLVFGAIDSVVIIYPTENYYYFEVIVSGRHLKGNIGLFADRIDSGEVNFCYEDKSPLDRLGRDHLDQAIKISKKDGLEVKRLGDFQFWLTFEGKRVRFVCNEEGATGGI